MPRTHFITGSVYLLTPLTHFAHHLPLATTNPIPPLPTSHSGAAGGLLTIQNSNLHSLPAGKPDKAEAWVVLSPPDSWPCFCSSNGQGPQCFTSMRATSSRASGLEVSVGTGYGLGGDSPWRTFLYLFLPLSPLLISLKCWPEQRSCQRLANINSNSIKCEISIEILEVGSNRRSHIRVCRKQTFPIIPFVLIPVSLTWQERTVKLELTPEPQILSKFP